MSKFVFATVSVLAFVIVVVGTFILIQRFQRIKISIDSKHPYLTSIKIINYPAWENLLNKTKLIDVDKIACESKGLIEPQRPFKAISFTIMDQPQEIGGYYYYGQDRKLVASVDLQYQPEADLLVVNLHIDSSLADKENIEYMLHNLLWDMAINQHLEFRDKEDEYFTKIENSWNSLKENNIDLIKI